MFPAYFPRQSMVTDDRTPLTRAYRDVVIYDDRDGDEPLYEGPIVVHANGWIELEGDRLLSPSAIHHIDIYDDQGEWTTGDDAADEDTADHSRATDGRRTNTFSP